MPIVIQGSFFFIYELKQLKTYTSLFLFCLGANKSIEECQYQFQDRHWNCSIVRDGSVFGPVLYHGKFFE